MCILSLNMCYIHLPFVVCVESVLVCVESVLVCVESVLSLCWSVLSLCWFCEVIGGLRVVCEF